MNTSAPLRILVVDDTYDNVEILQSRAGMHWVHRVEPPIETVGVLDGWSALEELSLGRFDLIITDLLMPGIDGYELVRRIRAGHHVVQPTSTDSCVPIIVASARTGDHWEYQAVYTLVKPLVITEVDDLVVEILTRK